MMFTSASMTRYFFPIVLESIFCPCFAAFRVAYAAMIRRPKGSQVDLYRKNTFSFMV